MLLLSYISNCQLLLLMLPLLQNIIFTFAFTIISPHAGSKPQARKRSRTVTLQPQTSSRITKPPTPTKLPDSKRSSQDLLPRALFSPPKHSMPQPHPCPSYCYPQYHYPPSPWSIPDYLPYQNPGPYYGQSSTSNTTSTVYEPSSSRHPFTHCKKGLCFYHTSCV